MSTQWPRPRPRTRRSGPTSSRSVSTASPADELAKAADLRDKGLIDDNEFQTMKAKILGTNA